MYPSVRTIGGGVMQLTYIGSKEQDVSSIVVYTKPNIIISLGGVVRQITKSILSNLKQRKVNCACMYSNAWIVMVITKQTLTSVCSGNIDLIANSIIKNKLKSMKTNVCKNSLIIYSVLETNSDFNIIFI